MKFVVATLVGLSILASVVVPAMAGCYPVCRQVPDGKGGYATVCYCG